MLQNSDMIAQPLVLQYKALLTYALVNICFVTFMDLTIETGMPSWSLKISVM